MGLLHESDFYPAYPTDKPFELVGTVWAPYQELRDVETKYGSFTGLSIAILPKGAEPKDDNVVSVLIKKGGRLSELSKAVKEAGASDIEEGGTIGISWDGSTRKMDKGDMRLWKFAYKAPAKTGGMLAEASGPNLLGD